MGARRVINRLGWACASIVVLVGCAREGGGAATNRPTPAVNVATLAAAPTNSPVANTSQSDLFPIDTNAADNATNTVDPVEAGLLAAKNADCVDQLIKAQPFGETRSQIIDNVTKACLPIAKMEAQASPKPPVGVDASERSLVAGRVHDLIDEPSSPPTSSSPTSSSPTSSSPPGG